jgi:hypothetical protein
LKAYAQPSTPVGLTIGRKRALNQSELLWASLYQLKTSTSI